LVVLLQEKEMTNMTLSKRRAKIVCTLGPSSNSVENIKDLACAGMDVARLNFSHGSHDEHLQRINAVRKVARDLNKPIAILQDLQGPKIRVQTFEKGKISLKKGSMFILTTRDVQGNEREVSVSYKSFNLDVKIGDTVLLDDGLLKLIVRDIAGTDVHCEVLFGGILSDKKGLNLPGNILSVSALTEKDKEDLEFGIKNKVDYIALSFVQKPEDVIELRNLIQEAGSDIPVVSKIEKPQAVASIEEIIDVTDIIMVARGDLGVEVSAEEVPPIQKQIIRQCNRNGVPVITATQMLDSMIHNPRPTRAEASDVANAIIDGTDAVMLSGETANGNFPVESVETMHRIVSLIEKNSSINWELRRRRPDVNYTTSLTIGHTAVQAADLMRAAAIVCMTQTGSTARMIARYRPEEPIIAVTHSEKSFSRMALYWGVSGLIVPEFKENIDDAITDVSNTLKKTGLVSSGNRIVVTAGLPFSLRRRTNMLRIEEIP
jgi:pyruvate kinase